MHRKIARRGPEARNALIAPHRGLVGMLVHRLYRGRPGLICIYPPDDAMQDGLLGLMRAGELYDETLGWEFGTYAAFWIRQALARGRKAAVHLIRVPDDERGVKGPTPQACFMPDGSSPTDRHGDTLQSTCRAEVVGLVRQALVRQALVRLQPRYAQMLMLRAEGRTYDEMSRLFGISRERIRQLESAARRAARRWLSPELLEVYQ
jgi:RNA polymerase sigma factor (sigma-70 family)